MTQEASHLKSLTREALEKSLQLAEAGLFKLESISISGQRTISKHDDETPVPTRSLVLLQDPNGDVSGPAGSALICRGEAWVSNEKKAVAAFRKAAVGAPPPAPPAAPSPPPQDPGGEAPGEPNGEP